MKKVFENYKYRALLMESLSDPVFVPDFGGQHYTADEETLVFRTHLYTRILGVDPGEVSEVDVPGYELQLREWWARRVAALGAAGWTGANTELRRLFLLQCYPFRSSPDLKVKPCNRTWICPYCWMRRVASYVAPFQRCLDKGANRQLVIYRGTQGRCLTNSDALGDQLIEAKRVRESEHWMAPPGQVAIGGLSYLCPAIIDDRTVIERRGLIVVGCPKRGTPLPEGPLEPWRGSVVYALCSPARSLVDALVRALAFPGGFWATPAPVAVRSIEALRGAHLVSLYGGGTTPLGPERPKYRHLPVRKR